MPAKKGAKAIEEDFSDVPTLPELNSLIFTMLLVFKDQERKGQVFNRIKEEWKNKVKVITRNDIIEYGKKKLTIEEDEDAKDVDKVAKAASQKLYEQFVTARREKRDRIAQLTEEAKATATEENPDPQPEINPNEIDCYFHLPDYPSNYEEAAALNKYKYALNAIFNIEERPAIIEKKGEPELDEEGNPIPDSEQVVMEEEPAPEPSEEQKELLSGVKHALKDSAKDSAIRTFVVINKEYNHKIIEPKPLEEGQAEGEQTEEQKGFNSVDQIATEVYQTLEKTASNLLKYVGFKKSANLVPLKVVPPQPEVESRLEDHHEEQEPQVNEVEASKEAEKVPDKKVDKSKMDKSKVDKSAMEEVKEPEPSVLEETQPRDWNSETYQHVVNDLPEDKKSIAGLLSACVINICEELEKQNKVLEDEGQAIDEDDEYKYLFDDILGEIAPRQELGERNIQSPTGSMFSKSAHKSMFSSARSRENWNQDVVLDSQDICAYANDYILANGDSIANIENGIFSYLKTPGIDRTMMPSVAEKSELRRNAERPEIYPFSTLPVEELERAMLLKAIEDQFKSKEPDYQWNFFDRCIEERYPKKALIQELSDALLWEPDCITKYFSRDDSLLLAIYQKLPTDKSYNKQWKASYKSMPDFSNWLEHFGKESDQQVPLYDIDDNKVGQLREFTQNLTPANGGLMRIKRHTIGMDEISTAECFKDGLIFGIHQAEETEESGDSCWISYDRDTRLDFRNIQGTERYFTQLPDETLNESGPKDDQDAPPPEDDDAEKARKQQIEEEKAQKEQERQKALDEAYASYKVKGSGATLTFNNGHLVTMLPNGYIMQSKNKVQREFSEHPDKEYTEDEEESRIVTSKSLIRYLTNGKIEIMYANGNFSQYDPQTDIWTITNNNGLRRCKRQSDGFEYDAEPIPACIETCPETDAQVLFKEDNVISVQYPNGTRYTVHHDGTKILTNQDGSEICFEKNGYSLVKVLSGRMLEAPEKQLAEEPSDADTEFMDSLQTSRVFLKDRIKDGRIIQTYLHDRSVIQSFVEYNEFANPNKEIEPPVDHPLDMEGTEEIKQSTQNEEHVAMEGTLEGEGEGDHGAQLLTQDYTPPIQAVHLIRRQDLSVTKVTNDGEICIITGPTRSELNKYGNLMKIGKDVDYLTELFESRSQERKGGIFTCSLEKSNIITHDNDRNYFAINSNGTFEKVLAPELSEVDHAEGNDMQMEGEFDTQDGDQARPLMNSQGSSKANVPKVNMSKSKSRLENTIPVPPRLFWIKVDGTGSEFFTKERMQDEAGRLSHDVFISKGTEFIGQNPVFMHSYFKHLKSGDEIDEELSIVADLQSKHISDCKSTEDLAIPKNVEEYKQMFRPLVEQSRSSVYLYKNYMQHKDFDHFKLSAFQDDLARYKKWKEESEPASVKRFGLFEKDQDLGPRSIDQGIMIKIYRERQKVKPDVSYNDIKNLRIQAVTTKLRKVKGPTEEDEQRIKVDDQSGNKERNDEDIVDDPNAEFREASDGDKSPEKAAQPASMIHMDGQTPKKKRTQIVREEITDLKKEPYFVPRYFETHQGQEFVRENPPKPPNDEVLMRMSQRMSRSIGGTDDAHRSSQEADRLSQYTQNKLDDDREKTGEIGSVLHDEMNDNAIVALEPEDDEDRDQMRMSGMKQSQMRSNMDGSLEEPNYVPSLYLQEKDYLNRKDEEQLLKAEEYHVSKTKEFSVYGKLRPLKLKVKSLAKSKLKPEMNEKFITTESITDKRIKISSMANRAYLNAPSITQVRKQGQHQMILNAIAKKQTFNELISQANAMVTSVLNDPMKRSVNILPSQANFGSLKEGSRYELMITCKNEDMLPQRVVVHQAKDPRIRVEQDKGGPIAAGMVKNIKVIINTKVGGESSVISDAFEVVTKTDVYRVPIMATILNEEKFEEINAESFKIHNKSAMRNTVREVYSRQKTTVNEMLKTVENKGWIETTGSESKLPSLPNIKNRAFEPDEQKELDEVIEKSSRNSRMGSRRDSAASRQSKASRMSKRA